MMELKPSIGDQETVQGTTLEWMEWYVDIIEEGLKNKVFTNQTTDIYNLSREALTNGGKRLRGVLALLACEAVCGDKMPALSLGISYELYHAASLIQDDIIDDSPLRRGKPTLNASHSVSIAILVADMMLFEVYGLLASYKNTELPKENLCDIFEILAKMGQATTEGEFLDLTLGQQKDDCLTHYFDMAEKKTGALIAAATASGAIAGCGSQTEVDALQTFGIKHGLAYQIADDRLDVMGDAKKIGKPIFNDLRGGKKNFIIIHALEVLQKAGNTADADFLNSLVGQKQFSDADMARAKSIVQATDSLGYSDELAQQLATEGCQALSIMPDSEAKTKLLALSPYLVHRYA